MNIPDNFDRWMFDYKEGNLSAGELQEFENFLIQNPEFEVEADAWNNAFVQNEEFVYSNAHQLEKKNRFAGAYKWSAAALILLLLGTSAFFVLNSGEGAASDGFTSNGFLSLPETSTDLSVYPNADQERVDKQSQFKNLAEQSFTSFGSNLSGHTVGSPNTIASSSSNGNPQGTSSNGSNNGLNGSDATSSHGIHNQNGTNGLNNGVNAASNQQAGNQSEYVSGAVGSNNLNKALQQEKTKFDYDKNSAKYLANPELKDLNFDIRKKTKLKYNSFQSKLKRMYRKIERQMGYPVALKNLRDPQLGIPQNTLLMNNPGFAGGMLAPRFELNYRNQWWDSDMNSQAMNISFDHYYKSLRGGVGVMLGVNDFGGGAYNDVNLNLFYSPKIALGKNAVLEPAIKMTMGVISSNAEKMAGTDQIEIDRGRTIDMSGVQNYTGSARQWYKDIGIGAVLNTKWFYVGMSADNLSGHYENVYAPGDGFVPQSAPTKVSAVLGADWEDKDLKMGISPFLAYERFDKRDEVWGGFTYRLRWLTVGGAVSTNKEWTASAGIKFKHFKLSYMYDVTSGQYFANEGGVGSHNIGIRFNAPPRKY